MRNTRAVFFDLDDTLFDHSHCAREGLLAAYTGHPVLERWGIDELEREYGRLLNEMHALVMDGLHWEDARVARHRRFCEECGLGHEADLRSEMYRSRYQEARRPVPGALDLLASLHSGTKIGIVTNNLTAEQVDKLSACRLDRYVDVLVTSEDVGFAKPHPRIFQVALDRAGCEAQDAVMVGDTWASDVEGARAASVRPVWFNRRGEPKPDAQVLELQSFEPVQEVARLLLSS